MTVEVDGDDARLVGRIVTDATVYGTHANWRLQLTMDYARERDTWTALRSIPDETACHVHRGGFKGDRYAVKSHNWFQSQTRTIYAKCHKSFNLRSPISP
ncbi:nuclear transport factor 2 family protein [Streptomyces sp. NBC_01136]|uniref:hypothetical protein n=1 Tax=unclassified Streptomyces TaxID=2593676 RepID=UPI00325323B6|nr:nuclear transport factor 2 family protein [Streptomyces sp. NBC_01136]